MTLDCPSSRGHLFTQGNFEALVCLNTRCSLYAQAQPDIDAQAAAMRQVNYYEECDDDEGDDD